MRKYVLAMAGAAMLAAVGVTQAADMGVSRPYGAPPAPVYGGYHWGGFYAGINAGYQWGDIDNDATEPSGGFLGGQLGYNWQNGQMVIGLETDLQLSNADDVVIPQAFSNPWFGTARGRIGYSMNNVMAYGTGGLAYGGLELETLGLSQSQTHFGWTLGVGAEVGFTPNWTAKVEYLYIDLSDRTYFTGVSHGLETSLLRAGVNYRF